MTELILIAIWLLLVLCSPHPIVGLIGGPIVYVAVRYRMWFACRQASHQVWKAKGAHR